MKASELVLTDFRLNATAARRVTVQLSFDEAFTAHHRAVYRYACALTRDETLAEDVVQEVFIRLHEHLYEAQKDGLLLGWLLRVTANVARNTIRRHNRARARDEAFAMNAVETSEEPLPDEAMLRRAEIGEARRALDKIKEPMRSCLLLKHEGLSYREIAAALGINESNVGSLIARGRKEFIRLYGKIGR